MKKGFTLAEVLITLTIIGVIAVLTIPNLMRKWEEKQTVTGVKEAYSILSNALKMAVRENGPMTEWTVNTNSLRPYLKVQKYCAPGANWTISPCSTFPTNGDYFKYLSGQAYNTNATDGQTTGSMILSNGMKVWVSANNYISVDINGKKGPNRDGYDKFIFIIDRANDGINVIPIKNRENFRNHCYTGHWSDYCSFWVLLKGNVDYQKRDIRYEW